MVCLIGPEMVTLSHRCPVSGPPLVILGSDFFKKKPFFIFSLKCPDFSLVQNSKGIRSGKMVPSPAALPNPDLSPHGGFPGASARVTYFMVFPTVIQDNSSQNDWRLSVVWSSTWKWLALADILGPGLVEAQQGLAAFKAGGIAEVYVHDHNNSGWKGPPAGSRPTSLSKLGQLWDQTRLLRDLATWALKTSEDRDCRTSLAKMCI